MPVSYFFNVFIIGSFAGWIYECIYCTIVTTRWQNRGFLFGPICPIYGTGLVGGKLVFQYLIPWIRFRSSGGQQAAEYVLRKPENASQILMIFLISALGSAILEYSTSWILEKLFHARWWDYSDAPLNVNGRICLPATLGFGAAGVLIVGYILPFIDSRLNMRLSVPLEELISLLFMFIMSADLVLSVSAVTRLLERIESMESVFDDRLEATYEPIGRAQRAAARKIVSVKDSAGQVLDSVKEGASGLVGSVKDSATGFVGGVKESATGLVDGVKEGATGLMGGVKESAGGMIGTVKSGASGIVTKTSGLTRGTIDWILTVLQRNTLMNIKKYSLEEHDGIAKRFRASLTGQKKNVQDKDAASEGIKAESAQADHTPSEDTQEKQVM